jgi:hypothetical protein
MPVWKVIEHLDKLLVQHHPQTQNVCNVLILIILDFYPLVLLVNDEGFVFILHADEALDVVKTAVA